jgi:hypothetical protein
MNFNVLMDDDDGDESDEGDDRSNEGYFGSETETREMQNMQG